MNENIIEPETEDINKLFHINQGDKNYELSILLNSNNISLKVSEKDKLMQPYEILLTLGEIKEIHNTFSKFTDLQDFSDIIEDSISKKEITINKTSENVIRFELKKNSINFELNKKRISQDELIEYLNIEIAKFNSKISNLETNYDNIIKENKNMKHEIDELKKDKETLFEENKKLRDEIKNMKGFENISEEIYNEIQNILNLTLKQEEKDKENEIALNEKLSNLNKDIQDIKKNMEQLKNKKDKKDKIRLESAGNIINKIGNKYSRNYSKPSETLMNKNKKINNIFLEEEEENNKINNIKKYDENSENNFSEFSNNSFDEEKYLLSKQKRYNKYNNRYDNYTVRVPDITEQNLNKTEQKKFRGSLDINLNKFNFKNIKKNIFSPINNYTINRNQNQLLKTKNEYYFESENSKINEIINNIDKININAHNPNKKTYQKNNNKVYKKQILPNNKKMLLDNKNRNIKYIDAEKYGHAQRAKSTINKDYNNENENSKKPFFIRNAYIHSKNKANKEKDQFHSPKSGNNSAKKILQFKKFDY